MNELIVSTGFGCTQELSYSRGVVVLRAATHKVEF